MATAVESRLPASTPKNTGVQPLRAGKGIHFLLRRLHSLSGIVPVGAFLLEHFISNAAATNGPKAYAEQVSFLTGLPFLIFLEVFGIYLPILYHSLYGFFIWYRGESNVASYPWAGNWMYTAQRWTGAIAFFYMIWHTWHLRFTGVHLVTSPGASFGKVQHELQNPIYLGIYIVAIIAASWHFAYGIWLFCAKWGITPGARGRKIMGYACTGLAIVLIAIGLVTVSSFFKPAWRNQPLDPDGANAIYPNRITATENSQ